MTNLSIVHKQYDNGQLVVTYTNPITKQSLTEQIAGEASLPYIPKNDSEEEQRYKDYSKSRTTAARLADNAASGNLEATKELFDRVLGKPKQETQNVNVNVTYQDYLDKVADYIDAKEGVTIVEVDYPQEFSNLNGI